MSVEGVGMLGAFHEVRADVRKDFRFYFAFLREKMLLSVFT
jgi:hypothetical protein